MELSFVSTTVFVNSQISVAKAQLILFDEINISSSISKAYVN